MNTAIVFGVILSLFSSYCLLGVINPKFFFTKRTKMTRLKTFVLSIFSLVVSVSLTLYGAASNDKKVDTPQPVVAVNKVDANKQVKKTTVVNTGKTSLTQDEFNKLFSFDPQETQYPKGKFKLKNGGIVYADWHMYGGNDIADYASAIFYKGKLVHTQLETSLTQKEVLKALGLSNKVNVTPYNFGFEITFDPKFGDSNIAILPNEWD